jgi:hypothetical protein
VTSAGPLGGTTYDGDATAAAYDGWAIGASSGADEIGPDGADDGVDALGDEAAEFLGTDALSLGREAGARAVRV